MKRIHVNRNVIDSNRKHGKSDPPITVRIHSNAQTKTPREIVRGHTVEIMGASRVVYRPDDPLSCGAKIWIETEAPVLVDSDGVWIDCK